MTTSGSITYNEDVVQLVSSSLQLLNVLASGETANASDVTFCIDILNKMLKAWMAQGIHLWTEEEGTVYFVNGQAQYNLATGGANASDGSGTPVETTTTTGGAGSSITCQTVVGMTVGDNIGIAQANNVMFWTTISSITPLSNAVGLASAVGSYNPGTLVATYTTQLPRPLSIQAARVADNNGFERPVWIKARNDYMMIPQKQITADSPSIIYYSPQMNTGVLYVWPCPNNVSYRLKITYLRTIQDVGTNTNTLDIPVEWLECVTFNLAVRLASAYGVNLATSGISGNPDIIRQANQYLEDLKAWDVDQAGIQITPAYRDGRY